MGAEPAKIATRRGRPRIFYGWWIVLVSFLAEVVIGASGYTFPIFYKPMAKALSLSRTAVAVAPTVRTFVSAFVSPVIGRLVDRRGPRAIMVFGAILMGITSMAMANIGELWHYLLVYSVMGAVAQASEGTLVTSATVAKWFVRKRGRAIALVSLGVSVSGVIFTPVGTYLVLEHGWRAAWMILGIITIAVLVVPAALLMRRQPEDMGLLPDGEEPAPVTNPSVVAVHAREPRADPEVSWTLQQAIRSPSFWLIIVAFNLGSMAISSVVLHQINYITDKGFSSATAAFVVTVYAATAIMAKLIYGFVSERVHVRYLVIVCFVGGSIGIAILNLATTREALLAYALVYGLTRGAFVLLSPLTWANYFGRAFQGTIRGFSSPFSLVSSAGGPLFAAWMYDRTESYSLAFTLFSITMLLGAFFMFLAKPTKPPVLAPSPAAHRSV